MRISLSPKKYFKAERYGPCGPLPCIAGLHERSFRPGSSEVRAAETSVFFSSTTTKRKWLWTNILN